MQSPKLKKPRGWIGLFLLCRTVSAEQGWVDPLLGQHKEISKPVSPGTALSSLPSSQARSRAITQARAASGWVCFKPICREKQLFSLGKKKVLLGLVSVQHLTEWDMTGMKFPGTNAIEVLVICVCACVGTGRVPDPVLSSIPYGPALLELTCEMASWLIWGVSASHLSWGSVPLGN